MKLNPLLVTAAAVYAVIGLTLTFAPGELLHALATPDAVIVIWVAQLLGAALLGLAYLNYIQRYTKTAGILGRPVLLPNLVFLTVAFFATLRSWYETSASALLAMATVLASLLAGFAARLFSDGGTRSTDV